MNGAVTLTAEGTGGNGGGGNDSASGGAGGAASLTNVLFATTAGNVTLTQNADGGNGGISIGTAAGVGGAASSAPSYSRATGGANTINLAAGGGNGGAASGGGTTGTGGAGTATATLTGAAATTVTIDATGGSGGGITAGVGLGGAGGAATSTGTTTSTGAGTATASVTATGGTGGASSSGPGGVGGNATSTASATGTALVNSNAAATGGNGVLRSRRGAAVAMATGIGTSGTTRSEALSGGLLINSVSTIASGTTAGTVQTAARAHVPDSADAVTPAAPDAAALAGLEAAAYAVGSPRVIDSTAYLSGNPTSQNYFSNIPNDPTPGATTEVLGLVTLGGNYAQNATGSRTYTSSATFAIDLTLLQTPRQQLVLALLDTNVQGAGFDSLQFQVMREGATVINQTFATVTDANTFLNDHVQSLGSNAAAQCERSAGSGLLDVAHDE